MKLLSNRQTKKGAALRPPVRVASSDHSFSPLSMVQRTTSLFVIRIKLAMPIRRLINNLPYHYSIYGIPTRCQARKRKTSKKIRAL